LPCNRPCFLCSFYRTDDCDDDDRYKECVEREIEECIDDVLGEGEPTLPVRYLAGWGGRGRARTAASTVNAQGLRRCGDWCLSDPA
jgi:hypothetical protein